MTAPTWKHFDDPAQQWDEFKRAARELSSHDLKGHAGIGRMCGCGKCFCCAARAIQRERINRPSSELASALPDIECSICRRIMSAEEYYSQHIDSHPCE